MVNNWILKTMNSKGKKVKMTLLYNMANNGGSFSASQFHSRCNNQGYTLTLVRNTKGYRCGGFTTQSWTSSSTSYNYNKNDPNAFLFSLEYKEMYPAYDGTNAIQDYYGYGPSFGNCNDLYIVDNCHQNNSQCNFPYYYCGDRPRSLSGGSYYFKVNELEVYKIEIV